MLTGDQLRAARERAGWTQQQLANRVGVTLRSVGNWERSNVPTNQLNKVRDVLADYLPGDTPGRGVDLHEISDARLLAEIARRFDRGRQERSDDQAPKTDAGGTPATVRPLRPPTAADLEGDEIGDAAADADDD